MTFTMSKQKASAIAAPNMHTTIVAFKGAIRMPCIASVLKSVMSKMDDAISQEPGRELHKCRRSREI
jgi:hypothetical protein